MYDITEEQQIAVRELRKAAYHEAGHKILHARFGGAGYAVVWKNSSGNPDETAWLGQYRYWACPELVRKAAIENGFAFPELPMTWKMLFGMAGLVAEEIMDGETDAGAIADTLDFRISFDEVSASDLASMGITDVNNFVLSYEAVEQTVQYLLEDWAHVQQEAESLITEASTESS